MTESEMREWVKQNNSLIAEGNVLLFPYDSNQWLQAYAFYYYHGAIYAVTKEVPGIMNTESHNWYVNCRAYELHCPNQICLLSCQIQRQQNVNDSTDDIGDQSSQSNDHETRRLTIDNFCQWIRSIFFNKRSSFGGNIGV